MNDIEWLTHSKVRLALHHLRPASSSADAGPDSSPRRSLLLLHGLGESSATQPPAWAGQWTGSVAALDFTGHGLSTLPNGGGYSAEILLADADIAVAALVRDHDSVTLVGRGLGAYIALMLAGSRPLSVHGAVLCDGVGLTGGATGPTSNSFVHLPRRELPPDPYALFELSRDLRPPDYATHFVRVAVENSGLEEPIAVAAIIRPKWLAAVVDEVGVICCSIEDALQLYA